ncbi:MAG: UDP-N-acetylglucosamine--undecaprenyl-phosphate N-acetylglucosaminephosphotransferase [Methylobacter sp.]|nr:UDP-N-acetylglucosamine--undecaprenyl-phosphate N-acetylglucosaminephosphotransferase [Methylobacter sp.]
MNNFETSNLAVLISSSFFITIAAMILLRPVAFKIGLTDKPSSRKKHQGEIPMIGGLAIYLCLACIILTQSLDVPVNIAFFTAVTIIVVTGLIDDFKDLSFKVRLAAEMVAALIMVKWGGIEITNLGNLLGFGEIQLGMFSTVFTVFAIVGGINAFNMLDGVDGLAGSTSLIIYFILSILCLTYNSDNSLPFCFLLAPATAAFLLFNFPIPGRTKAPAFLGDTGSMLLGFTICWLVISASQGDNKIFSPVTALWLIGAPILDTLCIMIRRIRKGRSPFAPDREHFHHILQVAGYGRHAILFIILSFTATLAVIGLAGDILFNAPNWVMFYLFMIVFALYYWGMSHAWEMVKVARHLREHKNALEMNESISTS